MFLWEYWQTRSKVNRPCLPDKPGWLPDKPYWCDPIVWLTRQFYLIADKNASWVKVNKIMERVRGHEC